MIRFKSNLRFLFILLVIALLFSACQNPTVQSETPTTEENTSIPSTIEDRTEAEVSEEGPIAIEVVSPKETVDIVSPEIRNFIANAQYYKEGDYSSTRKTLDGLGNLPEDVSFTWIFDEHEDVAKARLVYSKNADMSDATRLLLFKLNKVAQKKKQNLNVFNLETGTRYYWQIEIETSTGEEKASEIYHFDTEPGPRILKIDGVKNARDLGGWETADGKRVLQGLVFRTAKLENADGNGIQTILETLKINTELDLRNPNSDEMGNSLKGAARYEVDEESGEVLKTDYILYANVVQSAYGKFLTNTDRSAASLRIFTHPDFYPILFHCAAGADRTGSLALVLNALAGVSETDLVIDYELTPGRFRQGVFSDEYTYDFPAFMNAFRAYPGETLQEKARYFCKDVCGLSIMEVYNIEAMLTGYTAVYPNPDSTPLRPKDGIVSVLIDPRESGTVEKVLCGDKEVPFTFEGGLLSFSPVTNAAFRAFISFTDGTVMPADVAGTAAK